MKKKFAVIILLISIVSLTVIYIYYRNTKYKWEKGTKYTYYINYSSNTEAVFMGGQAGTKTMKGKMDCSLNMNISPFEERKGNTVATVDFGKIDSCSFVLNEEELFVNREVISHIFNGRTAFAEIDPSGRIVNLLFKNNEDPVFISSVKLFLGDSQFIVKPGFSWNETEKSQHGEYSAYYGRKSINPFSTEYSKEKTDYTKIHSVTAPLTSLDKNISAKYDVTFKGGIVRQFTGKESVSIKNKAGTTLFDLSISIESRLAGTEPQTEKFTLADMQKMISSKIGNIELDEKIKKDILKKAAKEMTYTEFEKTLKTYSDTKTIYDKGQFIRRSVAYLKLHPERCKDVYNFFVSEGVTSDARVLAMGILTSVGHTEAQTAMRDILMHDNVKTDIYYSVYLQNFSVLKDPDDKTVNFLKKELEQSLLANKNVTSSSLTIGAIAGKLIKKGKEQEAMEINKRLATLLKSADNDKDKERFIDALGNTGISSNLKIAEGYLNDPNNRVRASLSNVVRFNQTKESEDFLFKLAQDKDSLVKMQTINTLAVYDLKDEHLKKLNEYIKNDTFRTDDYLYLLQIYSKYENKKDIVKEALLEMKKRPTSNSHLRTTLDNMLKNH